MEVHGGSIEADEESQGLIGWSGNREERISRDLRMGNQEIPLYEWSLRQSRSDCTSTEYFYLVYVFRRRNWSIGLEFVSHSQQTQDMEQLSLLTGISTPTNGVRRRRPSPRLATTSTTNPLSLRIPPRRATSERSVDQSTSLRGVRINLWSSDKPRS